MRVLTDPVETGAVTVAIPQDVQAEAHDWPESLFAERTWHVARPLPERSVIARAAEIIRPARKPLIVAGGGVIYSDACEALAAFCDQTGVPVGRARQARAHCRTTIRNAWARSDRPVPLPPMRWRPRQTS